MKRSWVAGVLVTTAIGVGTWPLVSESRAASAKVVTLCYGDVDVRPWRYRKGGGLDFQLLERVGKEAGVSFRYEATPWERCLARLQDSEVDGVLGGSLTANRLSDGQRAGAESPGAGKSLRLDSEYPSYLALSPGFVTRRPELAQRISESVDTVRASAAYQILERQMLAMLRKT